MIQIFGILFFIILICLIYLHYQGKISRNIPIIFMFFLIVIIPFIYLEKNNSSIEKFSSYNQIMNSSLDIFYTNQDKKKKEMDVLKKIPLLYNPIQASIIKKNIEPFEFYLYSKSKENIGFSIIYNNNKNKWNLIYNSFGISENIFTYLIEDDFNSPSVNLLVKNRIKRFTDLDSLNSLIEKAPVASYIIIIANNIEPIKNSPSSIKSTFKTKYNISELNSQSNDGALLVVLAKSYDNTYTRINEKSTYTNNIISFYQIIKIEPTQVTFKGGDVLPNVTPNAVIRGLDTEPLINSKINIISPANLNPNYALSITVENNESFVYLSSRKLEDQVVLYSKSAKSNIGPVSSTSLDTQAPQFWSFESVTPIVTDPLIVYIRTYTKPYFYLDGELENGVMVLKAKRFKSGLRQQWEIIKNTLDNTKYNIRHLKSSMYLGYSDLDGYLYKDTGSVFLTKSEKYIWNIKNLTEANINKNVIEKF